MDLTSIAFFVRSWYYYFPDYGIFLVMASYSGFFQKGSSYCFDIRETFLYYSSHHSPSDPLKASILPSGLLLWLLILKKHPKVVGMYALAHPEWRRAMVKEKEALMVPGNLFHCLQGKALLMMGQRITYSRFPGVSTLGCLMDGFPEKKSCRKGIPHELSVLSQRDSP